MQGSPDESAAGSLAGATILTPDQRLRVFELGARPYPPRSLYLAYLRQSHVFVGIYGEQYGWVPVG